VDTKPKLKLKHTRDSEAVKELLLRTAGVPYEPRTKLLGGSSVGVKEAEQAKQVTELLKRFIA
jgi:hypothetical protein